MTKSVPPNFDEIDSEAHIRNPTSEKLDYLNALSIDPDIKPSAFLVAFVLMSFKNGETGLCCPALETVAELVNLSERQVENCLKELRTNGWLRWERGNRQKTNHYEFLMDNVGHMLDRRTSIDDARRERRKKRSDAKQASPQKRPNGNPLLVATRSQLPVATRTEVPTNTSVEHRKGTPEYLAGYDEDEVPSKAARSKR